ncbi:hypothetical protein F5X99DRAFT_418047 [Biscogniauxia marginata]|nr:hypothetical protein F5X99DRAFT_418047 [Biscogniauxia marginata]
MARKGSPKVRTGCLTCKIRKVKCDEVKPYCHRCVSTGRKCDGYAPTQPSTSLQWHRPRSHFPDVNSAAEIRHLQFFWEVAAPRLSGPMEPYFWTNLVLQFGSFEPAVRHSVIAISSLYERLHRDPAAARLLPDDGVVLRHYNAAIQEMKSQESVPLVLLVCVLFICIEFLRGNREAAIQHCKHGICLLETVESSYPWAKEYLSPIFRRLSLFPFFFGSGSESFPKLVGVEDNIPPAFDNIAEAQYHVDNVVRRTVRLLRRGDPYRLGHLRQDPVPEELLIEQNEIRAMLSAWHASFLALKSKPDILGTPNEMICNILMRYEVARIWADMTLEQNETAYDKYLDKFRLLIDEAANLASSKSFGGLEPRDNPTFSFEMGFVPLLFYIVMKCRCLNTRIRGLSLVKRLGARRETLWEIGTVYATGKRIIEIEHGVLLDQSGQPSTEAICPGLPADEMRVRETTTDPKLRVKPDLNGREEIGRMVGLFMKTLDGDIYLRHEFVVESL